MDLETFKKKIAYLESIGQSAIALDYRILIKRIEELENQINTAESYELAARKRGW